MSKADYEVIERDIHGLDISLLVYNVEVGEGGYFEVLSDSKLNRLIQLISKLLWKWLKSSLNNSLKHHKVLIA